MLFRRKTYYVHDFFWSNIQLGKTILTQGKNILIIPLAKGKNLLNIYITKGNNLIITHITKRNSLFIDHTTSNKNSPLLYSKK